MSATRWYVPVGLAVLATALGGRLLQADQATDQLVAELEAKAKPVESGRADLKMATTVMGEKMTLEGTILFKKPRKSRVELSMNMGAMKMDQTVISDGTTAWTYQPTFKMASKIDLVKLIAETGLQKAGQANNSDITRPLEGLDRQSIKLLRTEDLDGTKTYLFEGTPQTPEMPGMPFKPAKMQVWVGAEDGLLRKLVMFDQDGNQMMSQTYDHIQLNVDAPDGQFEFVPPQGVQVMDMTEGTINMIKGMKQTK